jgi:hypothetical protein
MPRSGSTWIFNAAREVLTSDSAIAENFTCGWIGDMDKMPDKPIMMLKVHDFDLRLVKLASYIFYSFRDIRDALASHARCFGSIPSLEDADGARKNYDAWTQHAHYVVKYESMLEKKLNIIRDLAKAFGVANIDEKEIMRRLDSLETSSKSNERYSQENLYHKNHITNGKHGSWHHEIDESLEARIVDAHRDWFIEHQYIPNIQ